MRDGNRPQRHLKPYLIAMGVTLAIVVSGWSQAGPAANPLAALQFRYLGPQGNRVAAILGEPGNPLVMYAAAADGGVWKTADGGTIWRPVFDHEDVGAVGALAMAPSEHNIIWAGTGEPWLIRPFYQVGDGVYKSTDAGRTWRHMGLAQTGHIARIIVDPHNPNRVFVCAIGQTFRPQQQRGVFRTLNGGRTWQQVLFVNQNTGCSGLALDPQDPNTLFAGMWQVSIHTWDLDSGGQGSGVFVTHDGGATWARISGHGLPAAGHPLGKVAVAIAPSNPQVVYALVQDTTPGLYRSNDGGKTWTLENQSHVTDERSPYYTRFAVDPDNENLLYFVAVAFSISPDGGKTIFQPGPQFGAPRRGNPSGLASAGGDNHDIWIDPTNSARILVANDSGVSESLDRGLSYQRYVLPIAQVYHVAADNAVPYHVMGNLQDRTSFRGPSNTLAGGAISLGYWTATGGCEDGFAVPDPTDADIVWSGCDNGRLDRMDFHTGMYRDVTPWPVTGLGWAPRDMKYRWHWSFPITISPHDHNTVYVGAQVVFKTTDGGESWKVISPDLTTNDKSHEGNSGGISYDNLVTYTGEVIYAIAVSPAKQGVIWTGSNDGLVYVTQNGGAHWTNVTANIPDLPPWGTVWSIAPSHFDPATAYVSFNFQGVGDYAPYVYETNDYGQSWKLITGSIPKSVNSSTRAIVEDPVRKGMLYLGTDNAIYFTVNDGASWTQLRNNFPPAPVDWLILQPTFNDLIAGTYGRGVWVLDDITPLRALDAARTRDVYLFPPRPAYRFRQRDDGRESATPAYLQGHNPPYGADVNFWLQSPQRHVELRILGVGKQTIRTLTVAGHAGLNRVWWDLRYASAEAPQLQVSPPDAPWADPHRRFAAYGAAIPPAGPIVPPGTYTVQLTIAGKQYMAPLSVLADPHSPGTALSIAAQVRFLLAVRSEVNRTASMINHLEWTRRQVENLQAVLGGHAARYAAAITAAKAFAARTTAVEGQLIDIHNTGRSEDAFRNPMQLYGRLCWLIAEMDGRPGSGSAGGDLGPTTQQVAVNQQFQQDLARIQSRYSLLVGPETTAFNALLRQNHVTAAIQP
ncbi:MAG: WD40/YVTN/BNR-like repeat-containing protein [Terriglobales bacterium]